MRIGFQSIIYLTYLNTTYWITSAYLRWYECNRS